jgi:hypothetical protein
MCVGHSGRASSLPSLLLATTVFELGWAWRCAPVAGMALAQLADTSEQRFYANSSSIVDWSLPQVIKALPELEGLEPAQSQKELPLVLARVGEGLKAFYENLPNTSSNEEIIQEQLGPNGHVKAERRQEFSYLILARKTNSSVSLEEYRADPKGKRVAPYGLADGFMLTEGFASMWLHFHPWNRSESAFRYLGQQILGGHQTHVIAFAQRPGWASVTGQVTSRGRSVLILLQGVAWIDTTTYHIVRMRTDLLAPRPDIALDRLTTEIRFGEVRFPQVPSPLCLPREVTVTTVFEGQVLRNQHRYSDYRLFVVESTIRPAEPDQPAPKNPD